jgi:hypothetical protein
MALKTGMITIDAKGTGALYQAYYPNLADWAHYYEQRVALYLGRIRATKTGAAVLDAIRRPITIAPLSNPTKVNAITSPTVCADATQVGQPLIGCRGAGLPPVGTGLGSRSTIHYTPGTWTRGDALQNRKYSPDAPGARPDEVLLHELVHGMRHTQGELDRSPMRDGFGRVDEFQAILVCNIYCSERGRPLRRNHHGHSPMPTEFATEAFRYLAWYHKEIRKFVFDHYDLAKQINRVGCPWNPIREHFNYRQLLRDILADRQQPRPGYW